MAKKYVGKLIQVNHTKEIYLEEPLPVELELAEDITDNQTNGSQKNPNS